MSQLVKDSPLGKKETPDETPGFRIIISRQPPVHVFSDEWFEVGFDLSSSFPDNISTDSIELCANLYQNVEGRSDNHPVKQHDDIAIRLATQSNEAKGQNGQSIVKCNITSPSFKDGQAVLYNIKFFQRMKDSGCVVDQVEAVLSRTGNHKKILLKCLESARFTYFFVSLIISVHIVAFKLSLECNWGFPVVFFKDEGGKDKHLQTIATLHRSDGSIAKGTHVPLKISLIYDNEEGSQVLKESEILKFLDGSKHYIDPDSGQSAIKFRIEDVSKNHQGKNIYEFKIVHHTGRAHPFVLVNHFTCYQVLISRCVYHQKEVGVQTLGMLSLLQLRSDQKEISVLYILRLHHGRKRCTKLLTPQDLCHIIAMEEVAHFLAHPLLQGVLMQSIAQKKWT